MSFYVTVLLIFIFCYWRVLLVIRRQASVMAGHSAADGSSTGQTHQLNHIQASVIKTVVSVSVLYAITLFPYYVCVLLLTLNPNPTLPDSGYYASLFVAFLYICINPLIYATKFEPVKEILLSLIPCNKISDQDADTATAAAGTNRPI